MFVSFALCAPAAIVYETLSEFLTSGDFNGDGVADIGLRDADNGVFYIKHGPSFNDQVTYAWAPG